MKKEVYSAIATLVGVVIGAGVLGIPYVVAKAGFLVGLIVILVIGISVMFMNLFMGEIVLRTKGDHQLTGYAEIYLGKKGKFFMTAAMFIATYGALIAYLIGEGAALSAIFGGNELLYSLGFFVVVSLIVYKGLKAVEKAEFWMVGIFLVVIFFICGLAISSVDVSNLAEFDMKNIFLPFGVVLFAFLGSAAIPEMREELIKNRSEMKKAVIVGSLIPLIVYILFATAVVGVTGIETSEVATIGLGERLGQSMVIFGNIFAIFAMATSFIALALALVEVWDYDYGFSRNKSLILTLLLPLVAFLLGVKSFIGTIGIAGAFAGAIEGFIIVFMLWKAKKHGNRDPEFSLKGVYLIGSMIIVIFALGITHVILNLLGVV